MEDVLESIRAAIAADASDDTRAAGVSACRTILNALEAKPGEALVPLPSPLPVLASPAPQDAGAQMAALLGTLRTMPAEQILDLAIARLRAALPQGADVPAAAPVKFHLIPLPTRK